MPVGGESLVTLAGAPAAGVLAHPLGTLTVAQRVAPLGLRLDHVDGAPVAPGTVVSIGTIHVGPAEATSGPATEPFARSRFQELSDDDRLTKPTFERLPAGARIAPPGQTNPAGTVREFDFEPVTLAPLRRARATAPGADHVPGRPPRLARRERLRRRLAAARARPPRGPVDRAARRR